MRVLDLIGFIVAINIHNFKLIKQCKRWISKMKTLLIYFSCLIITAHFSQNWWPERYNETHTSNNMHIRLINLMKNAYTDVGIRITDINDIRFLYEESPHYELGYVYSEIIERYKKMVLQAKYLIRQKDLSVYDAVDKLEKIQHLFFEITQLHNMLHEIYNKYSSSPDFADLGSGAPVKFDADAFRQAQTAFESQQAKIREALASKAKALKRQKRLMKVFLGKFTGDLPDSLNSSSPSYKNMTDKEKLAAIAKYKATKNAYMYFPIDYGWDLDYWE